MRDALAVYYFPGMWDWDSAIVLPLVAKGLDNALARQRDERGSAALSAEAVWEALREQAHALMDRYVDWAPAVDRFSPIRVATDFDAPVADPADPDCGPVGPHGAAIHYTGRIDLLSIDEHDRYPGRQSPVSDGPFPEQLLDEEEVAACLAWGPLLRRRAGGGDDLQRALDRGSPPRVSSESYPEVARRPSARRHTPERTQWWRPRGLIASPDLCEGSRKGDGRSGPPDAGRRPPSHDHGPTTLRPTVPVVAVRRSRKEVSEAGRIADEAIDMVTDDVRTYSNPVAE
ncbi:MAG: hypothetical protein ABI873_14920 [Marmoricola sp.]